MAEELNLTLPAEIAFSPERLAMHLARLKRIGEGEQFHVKLLRRSIDSRAKQVKVNIRLLLFRNEPLPQTSFATPNYLRVDSAQEVIVAGAGPAGLFAALRLIELGLKPVILERGKDVRSRRRDLAAINREHRVNPESNYCFGEGGAGTYSDGKLYTRSNKRGDIRGVLNTFFAHGAVEEILVDSHPHIGTNKLPGIIVSMREAILAHGGEVHFNSKITGIRHSAGKLEGVIVNEQVLVRADALILATGHSARDMYELLNREGIALEQKPFALGVRAEHPQQLIDRIQYHCDLRGDFLPPSSYALVEQVDGRGVYSFCMCPGGIIAPCATSMGEVVTNGWSPSKRDNPFANSGIVVEIRLEDIPKPFQKHGPLAGMYFQQAIEQAACKAGGGTQTVPAQRMVDFSEGRFSGSLPDSSYMPGVKSANLGEVLPSFVHSRLQKGFRAFGRKMKGYFTNEALVHAVESRTSTPVRIPRDPESLQHPGLSGLFPCGEGAGYAGGIVSAAMDGQRCAEAVGHYLMT